MSATKIKDIQSELNSMFLERGDEIEASGAALVAGEHFLMVGPPGTAKSLLADAWTERINGARKFSALVTKFSTPEELFGPLKLSELKLDRYVRKTDDYLPHAEIAFIDEIFKANSAVLNTMLQVMNERIYVEEGRRFDVPLLTMFAASNELPEGEELGALFDRLLVRIVVDYIGEPTNFIKLLRGDIFQQDNVTTIELDDLKTLQLQVPTVEIPDTILESIRVLKDALHKDGVIPGDRRWRASMKLLRAQAVIDGRNNVVQDDLALLRHALWITPQQVKIVQRAVLAIANPSEREALDLVDQIEDLKKQCTDASASDNKAKVGLEVHTKLKKIKTKLDKMLAEAQSAQRSTTQVTRGLAAVHSLNTTVLTDFLGIDPDHIQGQDGS